MESFILTADVCASKQALGLSANVCPSRCQLISRYRKLVSLAASSWSRALVHPARIIVFLCLSFFLRRVIAISQLSLSLSEFCPPELGTTGQLSFRKSSFASLRQETSPPSRRDKNAPFDEPTNDARARF